MTTATPLPQHLQWPPFGSILPQGWIARQMRQDLSEGFVGHLDALVPDLIRDDDIYAADRLSKADKAKDVGAIAQDDDWEIQYLWWNSETQSNWWDGYLRHALVVGDKKAKAKVEAYVERILASQDADGYLGIYGPDLRYHFDGENGELWAQASVLRTLLAYYEFTGDSKVLTAITRAVEMTMTRWPVNQATPFDVEKPYAGVGHGLVFTDVLDRLHQLTGRQDYLDYAAFLYRDYCRYPLSEVDIQLPNLLDPTYRFQGHGVHTWEHLRSLLCACYATGDQDLARGLDAFLGRLPDYLAPSGGPAGDEFILGKRANATTVGYEYCSIHELLDSLTQLIQKSGELGYGDLVESLLFNAGQGARHPDGMGIAYLKTDNSYTMTGEAGCHCEGESLHQVQTRFKYSPTHQEAAVCCVPNAGRIYPYYLKAMWMREGDTLVKLLYGPSRFTTTVNGQSVTVDEQSNYPFALTTKLTVEAAEQVTLAIKCRKPLWCTGVTLDADDARISEGGDWIKVEKTWQPGESFTLDFAAEVEARTDRQGEVFFRHGPLVYALPIAAEETIERALSLAPFKDRCYAPMTTWHPRQLLDVSPEVQTPGLDDTDQPWQQQPRLIAPLFNPETGKTEDTELVPMAATVLRQVTFALHD